MDYNTLSPGGLRVLAVYNADRLKEFSSSNAFKMKWLRQVLRVSWIAKKTNEWVLERAAVTTNILLSVKTRKLRHNSGVINEGKREKKRKSLKDV